MFGYESLALRRWHRNFAIQQCNLSETRAFKITPFSLPETKIETYEQLLHLCLTSDIQMYFATSYLSHWGWSKALIFSNIRFVFPVVNYLVDKQCSIGSYSPSRICIDPLSVLFPRYFSWRRWTLDRTVQRNGSIFPGYCVSGLLDKADGNEGTHSWAWNNMFRTFFSESFNQISC